MAVVVVDHGDLIRQANSFARQLHGDLVTGLALQDAFAAEARHVLAHYLRSLTSLESGPHSRYMEGYLHAQEGCGRLVALKRPTSVR